MNSKQDVKPNLYYEIFVNNDIWVYIHLYLSLFNKIDSMEQFSYDYNNGLINKTIQFEYVSPTFKLLIKLMPNGLVFSQKVYKIGNKNYEINFENKILELGAKRNDLQMQEILFSKIYNELINNLDKTKINIINTDC
jgi:hypothetical protein